VLLEPEDYDVEKIRIKVTDKNNKRKYLRTLPLHHSQREVEKHDDYSIFELTVYPSYDFIHEILSHGEELEVVEPAWVRNECKLYIEEMYKLYH
jgi:predicted DNA-binding transcriptional regulator YafY